MLTGSSSTISTLSDIAPVPHSIAARDRAPARRNPFSRSGRARARQQVRAQRRQLALRGLELERRDALAERLESLVAALPAERRAERFEVPRGRQAVAGERLAELGPRPPGREGGPRP